MTDRKKMAGIAAVMLAILAATGMGTYAFLLDRADTRRNIVSPGYLTTGVEEDYIPVSVDMAEIKDQYIRKVVKFTNKGTVPCYIRAAVAFSNQDFDASVVNTENTGDAVTDAGNGWIDGEDGWMYYTKLVQPGEETNILFDHVYIGEPDETYLHEEEQLLVFVTEESVSGQHGDIEFSDYKSAWDFHLKNRKEGNP